MAENSRIVSRWLPTQRFFRFSKKLFWALLRPDSVSAWKMVQIEYFPAGFDVTNSSYDNKLKNRKGFHLFLLKQSYVWLSRAIFGSPIKRIRVCHNSGWLHGNRPVSGAFCRIFRADSESGLRIAKFDFYKISKSWSRGSFWVFFWTNSL